jgi:hypothetical protein
MMEHSTGSVQDNQAKHGVIKGWKGRKSWPLLFLIVFSLCQALSTLDNKININHLKQGLLGWQVPHLSQTSVRWSQGKEATLDDWPSRSLEGVSDPQAKAGLSSPCYTAN